VAAGGQAGRKPLMNTSGRQIHIAVLYAQAILWLLICSAPATHQPHLYKALRHNTCNKTRGVSRRRVSVRDKLQLAGVFSKHTV
jgi:hypothetical protein